MELLLPTLFVYLAFLLFPADITRASFRALDALESSFETYRNNAEALKAELRVPAQTFEGGPRRRRIASNQALRCPKALIRLRQVQHLVTYHHHHPHSPRHHYYDSGVGNLPRHTKYTRTPPGVCNAAATTPSPHVRTARRSPEPCSPGSPRTRCRSASVAPAHFPPQV